MFESLLSVFPFGTRVHPVKPTAAGPRPLFVLGAYPSALHIRWLPPGGLRPVRAMAVANEPEPFWNGLNERVHVAAWRDAIGWNPEWGEALPAGALNGSSGRWVDASILQPLGFTRKEAWMTDCLDLYRSSDELAARLENTFAPFARMHRVVPPQLLPHPSEDEIVSEALEFHGQRLGQELRAAAPRIAVTLGNGALRVFRHLLDPTVEFPEKLSADPAVYGKPLEVTYAGGKPLRWIPLCHPGAPRAYRQTHAAWATSGGA